MGAFGAVQGSLRALSSLSQRSEGNVSQTSNDVPVCQTTTTIVKTTYVHYDIQTKDEVFTNDPVALASITRGFKGENVLKEPATTPAIKSGTAPRGFVAGVTDWLGRGLKQSDADAAQFLSVVTHN